MSLQCQKERGTGALNRGDSHGAIPEVLPTTRSNAVSPSQDSRTDTGGSFPDALVCNQASMSDVLTSAAPSAKQAVYQSSFQSDRPLTALAASSNPITGLRFTASSNTQEEPEENEPHNVLHQGQQHSSSSKGGLASLLHLPEFSFNIPVFQVPSIPAAAVPPTGVTSARPTSTVDRTTWFGQ
jgi:hypothetical protein